MLEQPVTCTVPIPVILQQAAENETNRGVILSNEVIKSANLGANPPGCDKVAALEIHEHESSVKKHK